jgi:hypothetical protein
LAGFVHGTSSLQTGNAGSINTTPRSPLFGVVPAAVPTSASAMTVAERAFTSGAFPLDRRG